MKKIISFILCLAMCLSLVGTINVNAATYNWPSTRNIKTYCISTRNDTPVYQTATSTWKYGTIYASDLITIVGYSGANRLKVSYPISGGRTKTGYIAKTSVTNGFINKATDKWVQGKYATVYRRNGGGATLGSISANDTVYKVASSGSYTQVIYPISGGWKMGWMRTSDIKKGGSNPSPTPKSKPTSSSLLFPLKGSIVRSSSVTTKGFYCDYKASKNTPVYAPANGTVVYKQAYRNTNNGRMLSSYGNFIEFTSNDGVYTVKCCHLNSFYGVNTTIKKSLAYKCSGSDGTLTLKTKTVKQGELLGYSGMTGNASGPHLHLEVRKSGTPVNPTSVFKTW